VGLGTSRLVLGQAAETVSVPPLSSYLRSLPWARIGVALLFAAPIGAFAFAAWGQRWMSDDGFIYLRVVDQLFAGNGPVFNPGERIEAATSPLWVGLLALASLVFPTVSTAWLAVTLGLGLSLGGLAFAQWGAYRLWDDGRGRLLLPLGALVIVALPPFWDFATSGLETGLAFAWLGACFWGLVTLSRSARDGFPWWLPVLLGLGPLVRPDFSIYAATFLAAFFVVCRPMSWRGRMRAGALAIALPGAYQVFRMGNYGALTPHPAFAKEASAANWSQGWRYLVDTIEPYWLPVPLLLLVALALPSLLSMRTERTARTVIVAAMLSAALAHAAYVVYVGGDFMHARLLLPAIFALLLPFAAVRVHTALGYGAALAVVGWALVCAAALRVPYDGVGPHGIANERGYYAALAQHEHPVTVDDYRAYPGAVLAVLEEAQIAGNDVLLLQNREEIALRDDARAAAVVQAASIGIYGAVFDTDVYIADAYGLVDPIAGRLALTERGRPGHEKVLPEAWVLARFADPAAPLPADGPSARDVAGARAVLSCDGPRRLLAAVSDPLTPGRFVRNVLEAFRLHSLRIPADPSEAQAKLC